MKTKCSLCGWKLDDSTGSNHVPVRFTQLCRRCAQVATPAELMDHGLLPVGVNDAELCRLSGLEVVTGPDGAAGMGLGYVPTWASELCALEYRHRKVSLPAALRLACMGLKERDLMNALARLGGSAAVEQHVLEECTRGRLTAGFTLQARRALHAMDLEDRTRGRQ